MTCYEAVLLAMLNETSVRKLKRHMPESVYPGKYTIEAGKLNKAADYTLVPDVDDDQKIRVYVLDDDLNKKPYGAWGQFYIMNYQPVNYVDVGPYPFGTGVVYQTGIIAGILPDGSIDFMENTVRAVLTDGAHGRRYFDLKKAEEVLKARNEISQVSCYMIYDPEVRDMVLKAEISLVDGVIVENTDIE